MIAAQIEDFARESEIILETGMTRYLRHRNLNLFFPCARSQSKFIIASTLTWDMIEDYGDVGRWKLNFNRL